VSRARRDMAVGAGEGGGLNVRLADRRAITVVFAAGTRV
jgi:hypothetical protein